MIAVSTDKVFSHKVWHDISPRVKKVMFPMASDPSGDISRAYGVYRNGVTLRGAFIIDPKGIIQIAIIHNIPIGRNINEIYRALRAAQYAEKHPKQGVPANWEPGQKGVPTGIDYVGKF